MFTQRRSTRAAVASALALTLITTAAPAFAADSDEPTTTAEARLIDGKVLGINLDQIAALEDASVRNTGGGTVTKSHPLTAAVLKKINISVPGGIKISLGDLITGGALGQYAEARNTGAATAAAGAVSDSGAVALGSGSGGTTVVDLDALLGDRLTSEIASLKLLVGAITSKVTASESGNLNGSYSLASLKLQFQAPAIKKVNSRLSKLLDGIRADIGALVGKNGALLAQVSSALQNVDASLKLAGASVEASATIDFDLDAALQRALRLQLRQRGLSVDLKTGVVTVDLAALPRGATLNGRSVGTEVLASSLVSDITGGVMDLIDDAVNEAVDVVEAALRNASVKIRVAISFSTDKIVGHKEVLKTVVKEVTEIVPGVCPDLPTNNSGGLLGGIGNLVGGVVGGVCDAVDKVVTKLVTTTEKVLEPIIEKLKTSVELKIDANVGQLLSGAAATATVDVQVLGIKKSLNLSALLTGLGQVLDRVLFGPDSTVRSLASAVDRQVLAPVTKALTGPEQSLGAALQNVVSVKLNVQEPQQQGDTQALRQTALRVDVAGGSLARLDLANARVAVQAADGTNPPGTNPPGTNPPGGNDPDVDTLPTSYDRTLLWTGVDVMPYLIAAMVVLLLGAGARFLISRRRSVPSGDEPLA